jgi:Big-like domain-containing protein
MLMRRSASPVVGVLLAGHLVGCASPTPTVPAAVLPPSTPVTGLTIVGLPESVSYGQTAQLQAMATLENGTQKRATDVTWQSSNTHIVSVSADGLFRVTGFGDVNITATRQDLQSSRPVSVPLPPLPVARLDVMIDRLNSAFAIEGVSNIRFDLSGSTGFGLRYTLDFGDGVMWSGTSEATTTHVYGVQPLGTMSVDYTVKAMVTDALGRIETVSRTVQVDNLPWVLGVVYAYSGWSGRGSRYLHSLRFTEAYPRLTGVYEVDYANRGPFSGTIDADGGVHLSLNDGTISFEGQLVRDGRRYGEDPTLLRVRVRGGPADGEVADLILRRSY